MRERAGIWMRAGPVNRARQAWTVAGAVTAPPSTVNEPSRNSLRSPGKVRAGRNGCSAAVRARRAHQPANGCPATWKFPGARRNPIRPEGSPRGSWPEMAWLRRLGAQDGFIRRVAELHSRLDDLKAFLRPSCPRANLSTIWDRRADARTSSPASRRTSARNPLPSSRPRCRDQDRWRCRASAHCSRSVSMRNSTSSGSNLAASSARNASSFSGPGTRRPRFQPGV